MYVIAIESCILSLFYWSCRSYNVCRDSAAARLASLVTLRREWSSTARWFLNPSLRRV